MDRPDHVSSEDWALLGVKRKYEPENPCPHIKKDGEPCGRGVMAGSEKCATHSGMSNPRVVQKRRVDLLVARYMEKGVAEGDDVSLAQTMNRALSAMKRAAEDIAADIADAPLTSDDQRFRDWLALTREVHKMSVDMTRLGQTDRALDAAEVRALPAWVALEDAVAKALESHPEARAAVYSALAGVAPQPEPIYAPPAVDVVKGELA